MVIDNKQEKLKWFKRLVEKVKNYQNQVTELETSVTDVQFKYDEIVARNIYLEDQIYQRTQELDRAQKSLLTLQHIWDTMKSAEPLGSVLNICCKSIESNLNYPFCAIMQIYKEQDATYLGHKSLTENNYLNKINTSLNESLATFTLPIENNYNPLIKALQKKELVVIKSFQQLLDGTNPEIDPEKIKNIDVILGDRAIVIVPLQVETGDFGVLYGISEYNEVTETEKDFLRLFADQIELAVTIARLFEQVREQAITDSLTNLFNRRYFDLTLNQEVERSLRLKQPFTLINIDMDNLKIINDTYGHSIGDEAIIHLSNVLKQNARAIDLPCRFGGEEFAVLLPGVDIDGGLIAAERIRAAIENKNIKDVGKVTASIGVATFLRHTDNVGELLELADQAMYEAKTLGKNKVCESKSTKQKDSSWQELAMNTFINILTKEHYPITPELANDLIKKLKAATQKQENFVDLLYETVDSLISTTDNYYKEGYSKNIVTYSVKLANSINLSKIETDRIRLAALLHDLGKMTTPKNILTKPGPLSEEEWGVVLQHPVIAAKEMLEPLRSLEHIIPLVKHHHEHWNGKGYPEKLSGEKIPLGSRIISIVDSYFAMTSEKPYRPALSKEEAIKILKDGANTTWDAKLIELFIEIIKKKDD